MQNRQKVLYLSLDYDDCGDILFDDHLSAFVVKKYKKNGKERTKEELANREQKVQKRIARAKICKEEFIQYLKKKAEGYDAVKLLVGSLRQSIEINEKNMCQHNNGSCFKNFADFCEEQKWITFDRFLLADAHNGKEAGTAMQDKNLYIRPRLNTSRTKVKIEIIQRQLEHIRKEHPNDDIDYIFIDDDAKNKFLNAIANELKSSPLLQGINFTATKYDYFPKVHYDHDIRIFTIHSLSTTHPCLHLQKPKTSSTALMMSVMPAQISPIAVAEVVVTPAPDNSTSIMEINHAAEMSEEYYPARKFI